MTRNDIIIERMFSDAICALKAADCTRIGNIVERLVVERDPAEPNRINIQLPDGWLPALFAPRRQYEG